MISKSVILVYRTFWIIRSRSRKVVSSTGWMVEEILFVSLEGADNLLPASKIMHLHIELHGLRVGLILPCIAKAQTWTLLKTSHCVQENLNSAQELF